MNFMHSIVDEKPLLSIITKIEILGFSIQANDEQKIIETFISNSSVLALTEEIANQTILLRKSQRIKLPDAIIAATALVHNLTLISRNETDFKKVGNLKVLDPYHLQYHFQILKLPNLLIIHVHPAHPSKHSQEY